MKIVIFCDMEGVSGVWRQEQVTKDSPTYRDACLQMTRDVNACARGCVAGGASTVTVRDVHALCGNVIWDELDAAVDTLVTGNPGLERFDCLGACDGLILLGYHAMAGTPRAVLSHTATGAWQNCWINGRNVGEIALDATRAGERGIPVLMTSGDDKLCAEAHAFLPRTVTVQVKEGRARESAMLLGAEVARKRIFDGAREAVEKLKHIPPYQISSPATVRVEFVGEIPPLLRRPDIHVLDGRTCEATRDKVEDAVNALID